MRLGLLVRHERLPKGLAGVPAAQVVGNSGQHLGHQGKALLCGLEGRLWEAVVVGVALVICHEAVVAHTKQQPDDGVLVASH